MIRKIEKKFGELHNTKVYGQKLKNMFCKIGKNMFFKPYTTENSSFKKFKQYMSSKPYTTDKTSIH